MHVVAASPHMHACALLSCMHAQLGPALVRLLHPIPDLQPAIALAHCMYASTMRSKT